VRVAKTDIARALAAAYPGAVRLAGVSEIRVAAATEHGRPIWVDVVGPPALAAGAAPAAGAGSPPPPASVRVRASDLRLALLRANVASARALYSMNCRWRDAGTAIEFYDGQGFGHGVGLCQWGAQGKARAGWKAEQILQFYYPGSREKRLY
jgi:hypothetical protein